MRELRPPPPAFKLDILPGCCYNKGIQTFPAATGKQNVNTAKRTDRIIIIVIAALVAAIAARILWIRTSGAPTAAAPAPAEVTYAAFDGENRVTVVFGAQTR